MSKEKHNDKITVVENVISKVSEIRPACEALAEILEKLLITIFPDAQKIQARAKTNASIAGKILKKYIKLNNPDAIFAKLTDLVGARVIFLSKDQVEAANEKLRKIFVIDDYNSGNAGDRLAPQEFGYQSLHYIIRCDKKWLSDICKQLQVDGSCWETYLSGSRILTAELQVRTWLQHVWADLGHDNIYKTDMEVPRTLRRSWNALAAIFENADEKIVACLKQIEQYRLGEPYYNQKELKDKIEILQVLILVLKKQLQNTVDSHQAGWDKKTFEKSINELMRLGHLAGREKELKLWMKRNDISNPISNKIPEWRVALEKKTPDYQRAFELNPIHPRVLASYLYHVKGDYSCDTVLGALLQQAVGRCDMMIEASTELPWAFAGKTLFLMILLNSGIVPMNTANIDAAYDSLLRLIDLCNDHAVANLDNKPLVATVESKNTLKKLNQMLKKSYFKGGDRILIHKKGAAPIFVCVKKLLQLGIYAHSGTRSDIMAPEPEVIIAGGCNSLSGKPLNDFKRFFSMAVNGGDNRINFQIGAGHSGICSLEFGTKNVVRRFGIKTAENADIRSNYKNYSIYEALLGWEELKKAKYNFANVALVGFGFNKQEDDLNGYIGGIANLECRIALSYGARVTVIRHSEFIDSARAFEQIPYWSKHPSLVHLPLICGDKPCNHSFMEQPEKFNVDEISFFKKCGFPEPMMLRVFMLFRTFCAEDFESGQNDKLVLNIHRIKRLKTMRSPEDLYELSEMEYKSELHRKLFFAYLCNDIGLQPAIEKEVKKARAILGKYSECAYSIYWEKIKDYAPLMLNYEFGEREHARWYIERWLQGQRYGANKIVKGVKDHDKKNPCMVAWYDLDDDTIEKDTEFLNRYIVAAAVDADKIKYIFKDRSK